MPEDVAFRAPVGDAHVLRRLKHWCNVAGHYPDRECHIRYHAPLADVPEDVEAARADSDYDSDPAEGPDDTT